MMDTQRLQKLLDRTKAKVFLSSNAAFYGPLLCSLKFSWDESIPTAATDGIHMMWNPEFFESLPEETRATILLHEINHVARLHMLRLGKRDPMIWNLACDQRINNDLENEGYSFLGVENCWKDQTLDQGPSGKLPEEDLYDLLIKNAIQIPQTGSWGDADGGGDLVGNGQGTEPGPADPAKLREVASTVARAIKQADLAGQPGSVPGAVRQVLDEFLSPVIDWRVRLWQFCTEMAKEDYSWARPNRRYQHQDLYLPDRYSEGKLESLMYFIDVSGSITDEQIKRFNSEVKFIQEVLNPHSLTLAQFDTEIQKVDTFNEDDLFERIEIVGRGGTSLVPVRQMINKHRPMAVIVFSDLECEPMDPLDFPVPIFWAKVGKHGHAPAFGEVIPIPDEA